MRVRIANQIENANAVSVRPDAAMPARKSLDFSGIFLPPSSPSQLAEKERGVAKRDHALNFVSALMAIHTANRMELENIEFVLDFGRPSSETVINVRPVSKAPPPLE